MFGHAGNLARLGEAAAPAQVEHGHTRLQIVLEVPFVAQRFTDSDQGFAVLRMLFEQIEAVHADGIAAFATQRGQCADAPR